MIVRVSIILSPFFSLMHLITKNSKCLFFFISMTWRGRMAIKSITKSPFRYIHAI